MVRNQFVIIWLLTFGQKCGRLAPGKRKAPRRELIYFIRLHPFLVCRLGYQTLCLPQHLVQPEAKQTFH